MLDHLGSSIQHSPPRLPHPLVCICLLFVALCFQTAGQSYTIDWSTIDGGGGTCTGGVYSVSGTIGQPDAGSMSGGNYTLQGWFWGMMAAVQTPGTPLLFIFRTATNTVAGTRGLRAGDLAAAVAADPRIQRELDRLASESKAAESDLLNEVW